MIWGYVRVSSSSQSLEVQTAELIRYGVERIVGEKQSARTLVDRPELTALLNFIREGDKLCVTRLDRLARSISDLLTIVKLLEERKCALVVVQQPIETATPQGRFFLTILGAVAQFDNELRKERQLEGVAHARASGNYLKNPRGPSYDYAEIARMKAGGMTNRQISKKLKCAPWTVYRALKAIAVEQPSEAAE
jgi:DNA invertase Pin-like site-specific DNA recombinase